MCRAIDSRVPPKTADFGHKGAMTPIPASRCALRSATQWRAEPSLLPPPAAPPSLLYPRILVLLLRAHAPFLIPALGFIWLPGLIKLPPSRFVSFRLVCPFGKSQTNRHLRDSNPAADSRAGWHQPSVKSGRDCNNDWAVHGCARVVSPGHCKAIVASRKPIVEVGRGGRKSAEGATASHETRVRGCCQNLEFGR